jgi:hypothetical protein
MPEESPFKPYAMRTYNGRKTGVQAQKTVRQTSEEDQRSMLAVSYTYLSIDDKD